MFSLSPEGFCRLETIAKRQMTDSEKEDTVYSVNHHSTETPLTRPGDLDLDAITKDRPGDYHKRTEHQTAISKSLRWRFWSDGMLSSERDEVTTLLELGCCLWTYIQRLSSRDVKR